MSVAHFSGHHVTAAWTALQGVLVQAVILHRAGYAVWHWQDRAILRAVQWLLSRLYATSAPEVAMAAPSAP
jgi:hypothetical protein